MTKRYIICTSNLVGTGQQEKLADRLTRNNLTWWHWLPNTWLVVDYNGQFSASSYSAVLQEEFPSAFFIVLEYHPGDWSGYGPTGSGNMETDMFAWIKTHWIAALKDVHL